MGRVAWLRGLYEIWKWKRTMDDVDLAQRNQMDDINRALRNRMSRAGSRLIVHSGTGEGISTLCEDCDVEIPQARRRAVPGCTRCVVCQEQFEREGK
ncbi:MAG: TraR/DksA C4-type zinc finger protein [Desulfobulbaceae bacterium]